jgi:hypothetical protein
MSLGIAPKTGLTKQRIHGRQSDFPKICAAIAKMKSRGCTQTHPYPGAVVAAHCKFTE